MIVGLLLMGRVLWAIPRVKTRGFREIERWCRGIHPAGLENPQAEG
jgi:hypothetical protein